MALHHAKPTEIVHLTEQAEGEPNRTALVKTSQFEAIRLSLPKGETIPAHHVEGFATVHCLFGSVEFTLDDRSVAMTSGDWLYLDQGQRHGVRSIDDSALLVTIMLGK